MLFAGRCRFLSVMHTVGMETNSEQGRMRQFKVKHYVDNNNVAWGLNYSLASLFQQKRRQCPKEKRLTSIFKK